jgi:hypothetical protein
VRATKSGGGDALHFGIAVGTTIGKTAAAERWLSGGTVPGIDASRRPRLLVSGKCLEQVDSVRMKRRSKNSFASATSTIWPAYINANGVPSARRSRDRA